MAQPTQAQWAATLLRRLGIHQTPGAVQALTGWANAEGGHWHNDARFNPLNTTQPEPGAGNTGTQGNIKVYKNWDQGLQATVETLRNGRYGSILKALQSGNPNAVANAIGQTPWGTSGGLVQKTIASTPRVAGVHAFGAGGSGTASPASASPGGGAARTTTTTTPGVDNSSQRRAAIAAFLGDRNSDPLSFAMQVRSLRDVPGQKVTTARPVKASAGSSASSSDASTGGTDLQSKLISRANALDKRNNAGKLPYQWGGGHAGKTSAYSGTPVDCSGAVSSVLGINPKVSGQFESWGKPGEGGTATVYANAKHVFMKVRGRDGQWHFFGTSGSNPGGGAGWIKADNISPEYLRGFTARHI